MQRRCPKRPWNDTQLLWGLNASRVTALLKRLVTAGAIVYCPLSWGAGRGGPCLSSQDFGRLRQKGLKFKPSPGSLAV